MIQELYQYINDLEIIDTHEHLPCFEKDRPRNDVIDEFLSSYFFVDILTSGISKIDWNRVNSKKVAVKDKWKIIEPYWKVSQFTGYGQSLSLITRDIYGIETINADTIEILNERFQKTFSTAHFNYILKEKSNIKVSIRDVCNEVADEKYYIVANRIDRLIYPNSFQDIINLEEATETMISSFEDYLEACAIRVEQYAKMSNILKLGIAYSRDLDFKRSLKSEAESDFNHMLQNVNYAEKDRENRVLNCAAAFSNYVLRFILGIAQRKGMIIQIHTGLQDGNGSILSYSKPIHLNELFIDYPKLKFDIFHIGYPYQNELGVLCKMFPNVFVDMCWAHIVSPVASRATLSEWLEFIPYHKISGFGGDYAFIDGVYGHQYIARKNIAKVLSEKVQEGLFDIDQACGIAKAILYDNPARIFEIN